MKSLNDSKAIALGLNKAAVERDHSRHARVLLSGRPESLINCREK